MYSSFRSAAKFTHDDGFLISNVPNGVIGVGSGMLIPANVLVGAENIEDVTQWVVDNFGVSLCTNEKRGCGEATDQVSEATAETIRRGAHAVEYSALQPVTAHTSPWYGSTARIGPLSVCLHVRPLSWLW